MKQRIRSDQQVLSFHKGRGAASNLIERFTTFSREPDLDFLDTLDAGDAGDAPRSPLTRVTEQRARSIISRNDSPDIPFDQSVNPYQGCEHGCIYCYARPSHAYLGLSPGLDFETRIMAKTNAAEQLRIELNRPAYVPALIALGANTDPYQPAERDLNITRSVLQVLADYRIPVGITTKSALVLRDLDILAPMAKRGLASVHLSLGTLDPRLARTLEPRANSPERRLAAIKRLTQAGIPVAIFASPIIPGLNDHELEQVMEAAANAGASQASYVLLRLPLEVRDLFVDWLHEHYPLKAAHVMNLVRQTRDGRDYDADYRVRMKGSGDYARLIAQRFKLAARRLGLQLERTTADTSQFRRPAEPDSAQLPLF